MYNIFYKLVNNLPFTLVVRTKVANFEKWYGVLGAHVGGHLAGFGSSPNAVS